MAPVRRRAGRSAAATLPETSPPTRTPSHDGGRGASGILCNIANPALDPTLVARAFHISVRQLHRLFEDEEETVGQEIRARRIQRCAEELRNPHHHRERISDTAARWGISDASKFSRQFRSTYGVSPRDYRLDHHIC
ncbi:helix-turn-helix domain-containing protein [Streptomyces niveus]|uniref:helix-turn-helix domain-containing protein n=1 Tax=Streptomyces niveus TaxID=193462 RepID=UPI003684B11D